MYSFSPCLPTTRTTDAAGAAFNLGATFWRFLVSPLLLVTTASSAADADVGRFIVVRAAIEKIKFDFYRALLYSVLP
jgi:hypothetical protein